MPLYRLENLQAFQAINVLSDPGVIGGPKIIPNCAEVRIGFTTAHSSAAYCILTGRYTGAFATTQTQVNSALSSLVSGATWTALAAFWPTTTGIGSVSVRDLNSAGNAYINSSGPAGLGTSVSAAVPSEMAVCVTFRTAKAGTGFRGRMYVPCWATNAIGSGDTVAAAAVTALQNWATTNIANAMTALSFTHAIAQPARKAYTGVTGTQHPARAAGSVDVTSRTVLNNTWDSQRRRGLA